MAPDPALPDLRWDTAPRLIVGWRDGASLAGGRVPLDENVLEDLREIARETLQQLQDSETREYEPNAALDQGEQHFTIPLADLPTQIAPTATAVAGGGAVAPSPSTAAMLALTSTPDSLNSLHPSQLKQHSYLFYGLVFDTVGGETVTFVKKVDPAKSAAGYRISLLGRDVLRRTPPPRLVLSHDIDLLITQQHVLVRRKPAFDRLFNDVKVALQDAPANIARTKTSLSGKVALSAAAETALTEVGTKRPTYATRLRALPDRIDILALTAQNVRDRLTAMGNVHTDLLDGDEFSFDAKSVGLFLDLLEGRHFDDEWTGTRMKADRMSHHKP
ncbi:hypothetical protein [Kineococcus rubinsiae]|uniref:hypothetical protein n=1 Tax=Kineococcus rubinsiae TaxID=2609562 RepID=UPI00142F9AB8|nr:hypothetical protein [Kineococcus rubinsiae]NIZ93499.1 hypothetical protein [Kineococcus rubinsiae]